MSISTKKLRSKVDSLSGSLDDLESQLQPLLSQTLPETVVSLDTLQQANLQVLLPYIINGLIIAHLKIRGIDPKTHPVIPELERIRQYFAKIKEAEAPETRRTEIDKAAAARFIKSAIASAQQPKLDEEQDDDDMPTINHSALPSTSTSRPGPLQAIVPPRITSKMKEREEYEKRMREEDEKEEEEDDDVLEVFDGGQGREQNQSENKGNDAEIAEMEQVEKAGKVDRKRKKGEKKGDKEKKAKRRKSNRGLLSKADAGAGAS